MLQKFYNASSKDFTLLIALFKLCNPGNTKRVKFNPLTANVPHYIEISQLICIADQLTGFYMMGNIGRYWINAKTYVFLVGTVKDFMKDIKATSWAPGSPSQIKFGIWVAQGSASLNQTPCTQQLGSL